MKAKTPKLLLLVLLTVSILFGACGCNASEDSNQASGSSNARQEVFNPNEYVLYQNIFYNGYGADYDGKTVTKDGVFATISDAYHNRQRYYVWGYSDQTKCCDWQWEFVPQEGQELPSVGSRVKVTGKFVSNENALDGYWISDAQIKLKTEYTGPSVELNMYCMSCTLERVQIYNIMYHSEAFVDKEFSGYARVASLDKLEDPYYDGSWQIGFEWGGELPAIGTLVAVSGSTRDGKLLVRSMKKMS